MNVLGALTAVLAVILSLPAWSLLLLTLRAGRRPDIDVALPAPTQIYRVAVLIPAHNESLNVVPTVHWLKSQITPGSRIVVIADNCGDDTVEFARQAGAEVIERTNDALRGKGYALAFGIDALRAEPPDVVMVVDADCTVSDGAVQAIAARCLQTNCPVQMLDLMHAPADAGLKIRILEFAWLVKNFVRPLGAFRLGGACHLMGTGMAFPWPLIANANLATGHIAEDMKLGVDLAIAGHPTQFFLDAKIISAFPLDSDVARAQKSRWEHGHLRTLQEELPRIARAAVAHASWPLFALAIDLLIPPIALYFLTLAVAMPVVALLWFISDAFAVTGVVMVCSGAAFAVAIALCWWRYGRELLSLRDLVTTPFYALWKIPVYLAYAFRKKLGWVRTTRSM